MSNENISKKIEDIKKQLDEVESEVFNTIDLMDLRVQPLEDYPSDEKNRMYSYKWDDMKVTRYSYREGHSLLDTPDNLKAKIEKLKKEVDKVYKKNQKIIKKNLVVIGKVHKFMTGLGFHDYRYESSGRKNSPSRKVDSHWYQEIKRMGPIKDDVYKKFIDWYEGANKNIENHAAIQKKKDLEAEKELKKTNKLNKAIQYLIENGKKLGVDFDANLAISSANELKCDKLIAEQKGEEVSISCCSECSTWTAGEHRCSCGNRRMYWDYNGDFEEMYLFPMAD